MGILNTRSLTIKGSKVTGGAPSGGGVHKFLGRPVKGGIRGSNALQEGLIAGVKQARATFTASLQAGFKRAGANAFNQNISARPLGAAGAGVSFEVFNSIPGISQIDVQKLISNSMRAATGTAQSVARSKMSSSHTQNLTPKTKGGVRPSLDSLIDYEFNESTFELSVKTPGDPQAAAKLFALNFGTGPKNTLTGGQR